jgi:hypothetical protein
MARARLTLGDNTASLDGLQVLWRDPAGGRGGQFRCADRLCARWQFAVPVERRSPAHDAGPGSRFAARQDPAPDAGRQACTGNPFAGQASAQSIPVINPPQDTEVAKTATVVRTFTYPASAPNMTRAETWTLGHRTPYGLAFAPNGQLWELEHGPRGGDKLNLIERGKNYGWPLAGYAPNYNGVPVPTFDNQPNLTKAVIQWTPVIAPGVLTFYRGPMFPQWNGSALAGGMGSKSLTRIVFDGKGGAEAAERWDIGFGVRDAEVAPDGALWISEGGLNNNAPGNLYRLTPK